MDVNGEVVDAETLPSPTTPSIWWSRSRVLHHIPDLEQSLREVVRVLKPGGRFAFAGEPTAEGDRVARRCHGRPGGPPPG